MGLGEMERNMNTQEFKEILDAQMERLINFHKYEEKVGIRKPEPRSLLTKHKKKLREEQMNRGK